MFGKKKPTEHTVLLLDIENASVGVALAHLQEGSAPTLFAEHRTALALPRTLHGPSIAKQIEQVSREALLQLSVVAARLRANQHMAKRGEFTEAAVFLGAPWGVPNLSSGKAEFSPHIQKFIMEEIRALAPETPLSFYTSADSVAYGSRFIHGGGTVLLAILRGEIIELVLLGDEGALGYGTLPIGSRSIYRTLQTHAGLSLAEIPAVLALAQHSTNPYHEPLEAAGRHMLEHFASGVEALVHAGEPQSLVVIVEEPLGSWFARMLENDESLGALFAQGSTVRTFGGKRAATHLAGHAAAPDLHLTLDALFADAKSMERFNSV